MIIAIVMIGCVAIRCDGRPVGSMDTQSSNKYLYSVESFSLFNDFAIQLSIISFIKSWHARTHAHVLHSHRGRSADLENSHIHIHIRTCWVNASRRESTRPATRLLLRSLGSVWFCFGLDWMDLPIGPLQTKWLIHVVAGGVPWSPPASHLLWPPRPFDVFSMGTGFVSSVRSFVRFVRSFDRSAVAAVVDIGVYVIIFILTWSPAAAHPVNVRKNLKQTQQISMLAEKLRSWYTLSTHFTINASIFKDVIYNNTLKIFYL